jgi:D-serine deaminase-like pyridoxal phosphate-dependent protein
VAYPLVGPSIGRFVKLRGKYPSTVFWALGDNLGQLELLGNAAAGENQPPVDTLIDVNIGMNRTGVQIGELEDFYLKAVKINGLDVKGFHCYDGHLNISDLKERKKAASNAAEGVWKTKESLEKKGCEIPVLVFGGTPTFACHRERENVFLSPGTFFINDSGYSLGLPDLEFTPGAAILTRVVSHPAPGLFTVDTGVKAVSPDHAERGIIAELQEAKPVLHSEEHWVWKLEGLEDVPPPVGSILYIIPNHICPTSALYPGVHVVKNGKLSGYWEIGARNRKITV